jgi:hypothetical protein
MRPLAPALHLAPLDIEALDQAPVDKGLGGAVDIAHREVEVARQIEHADGNLRAALETLLKAVPDRLPALRGSARWGKHIAFPAMTDARRTSREKLEAQ